MNAQQLKNAILQDLYSAKDGWNIKELKDVVADSCPISYGIVQQGNHVEGGVPVVRPVDLHTKYVGKVNLKCTSKDISDSYKRTVLNGNEVLLCVRGTTGIVALATEELKGCNVNRGIVPLYFGADVDKMFIYYQLQAPFVQETIEENTMGSALKQINIKDLRTLKLRVPSLAEQKRIVAKIEELLPKVEEYGKAQEALDKLNEELPERLKKSILQEAITGRLVPQDPNDEPASVLLDKIREEKKRLFKEGKLKKKDLEETPISEDEKPFEIPESWEWVRWDTLSESIQYGYNTPAKEKGRIKMVRISDIQNGEIVWTTTPYCDIDEQDIDAYKLKKNDILFARTGGTVGKSYLVSEEPQEAIYAGYLIRTRYSCQLCPQYLKMFMDSSLYWEQLKDGTIATAQPNCNGQKLAKMILPLQKRIVAKIEELFGVLDGIKESLEV